MAQPTAQDCIDDVVAKLKASGEFGVTANKEKVFTVYSEEDLFDKSKYVEFPAVGLMYEGTRANGLDPSKQGLASDCTLAIVLLLNGKSVGGINTQHEGSRILSEVRKQFKNNCGNSPTGHKWRFVSEIPAGQVNGLFVFIQRWSTAIIMT